MTRIHPVLTESLARMVDRFSADDRCVGIFLSGSLGAGTADSLSDIDVDAVIRDEDYPSIKSEIRSICESLCGPIRVWLPEGDSPEYCNYAYLFEAQEQLLLVDFSIMTARHLNQATYLRPQRILFDRTGMLAAAANRDTASPFIYKSSDLLHQINIYWVYNYLNGKYYQRSDVFKLLYVQDVLMQTHMRVLHAFYPQAYWYWWPRDIQSLPMEQQIEFMVYFQSSRLEHFGSAIQREMDVFSRDAQAACAKCGVDYPLTLEQGVREHLRQMHVTAQ